MVSRRNFFSITIMMLVLLVLFQFSMVLRDRQNTYDTNANLSQRVSDGEEAWSQETSRTSECFGEKKNIIFIGNASGSMGTAVTRWGTYIKQPVSFYDSLAAFEEGEGTLPQMLILESETYALGGNLVKLRKLVKQGVILVFGCLEDPKVLAENESLRKFLGIRSIVSETTELNGVRLFAGLLLGGESVYETPEKEDEKKRQDLELTVPWYQVGSGTKTYMVGLLPEESEANVKNEDLPTLIWRNGMDNGSVFAVVGDYLKDSSASGLLDGMLAEASDYTIYPIVNAQNLSMVDFPVFADENSGEIQRLYSQRTTGMVRDIMWPSLISITEQSGMKMTCFVEPQEDYLDGIEPNGSNMEFYLKQDVYKRQLQIDGNVADVCSPYPIDKKFEAFNFHVISVADGNDFDQLESAFEEAKTVKGMPVAIVMKTVKGKGVSFMENQAGWHGKAPNDEEYKIAMQDLEKAGEALCQK